MKFLADMGISQSTVKWLREKGYDAVHLREEDLHKMSDKDIVKKARNETQPFALAFPKLFKEIP